MRIHRLHALATRLAADAQRPGPKPPAFQPKVPAFQPKTPVFQPKTPINQPPPAAAAQQPKGKEPPKPEDVTLETKDGLTIKATYYPGTAKKESVPLIMIHGLEGAARRLPFARFIPSIAGACLDRSGLAGTGRAKCKSVPMDARHARARKPPSRCSRTWSGTFRPASGSYGEGQNAGELNIEELCVIGAELGSILAVRWAAYDWSLQDLPAYKQGKDVEESSCCRRSLRSKASRSQTLGYAPVQSLLSIMFVAGLKDSKSSARRRKEALRTAGGSSSPGRRQGRPVQDAGVVPHSARLEPVGHQVLGQRLQRPAEHRQVHRAADRQPQGGLRLARPPKPARQLKVGQTFLSAIHSASGLPAPSHRHARAAAA